MVNYEDEGMPENLEDLSDEQLEELIKEIAKDLKEKDAETIFNQFPLYYEPASSDMEDLLMSYTKETLCHLADLNRVSYTKSSPKIEIVTDILEGIFSTFVERLLFMTNRELELIQKYLANDLDLQATSKKDLKDSEDFYGNLFPKLVHLGLVYFKKTSDGGLDIFIANEFVDALDEIEKYREEHPEIIDFGRKGRKILNAGVNLYGVMNFERFIDLYHILDTEAEDTVEFTRAAIKMMPILVLYQNHLIVNPTIVAHQEFADEFDAYNFYTEIKEKMMGDYYKPTPKDIEYYAENSFDRRQAAYKKLKQLSKKISDDPAILMERLEFHINFGDDTSTMMDMLNIFDLVIFDSEKQIKQFFEYFTNLSNTSRMWVNAGYTPSEMSSGGLSMPQDLSIMGQEKGKSAEMFNPTKTAAHQPVKKVGRNEPCPCGSGKKYKKCCWKKDRRKG